MENVTVEAESFPVEPRRRLHFEWILPLFFKPRATLKRIADYGAPSWLTPLLILTVLGLIAVLVGGPVRQAAAVNNMVSPPEDFQYWTPEMQAQFQQSQESRTGPMFVYVFPIISMLTQVWLVWFILSAMMHLLLTLSGSRSDMTAMLNLVGWASLPIALRFLVQIVYLLATKQPVAGAGLSGFVTGEGLGASILVALLALVDIYFIWQVVLLLVGAPYASGLTNGKVVSSVLISVLVVMVLMALPDFILSRMSGLSFVRPFLF